MPESPQPLYTIGHSNRTIDAFLDLLRSVPVQGLVDVRAYPRSRRHPQFEGEALQQILAEAGAVYRWAGRELGGFRKGRPDSPHCALKSTRLRAYADHMDTDEFRRAVVGLIRQSHQITTAIMCAEKQPTSCHRSLIADHLTLHGIRVLHIIDVSNIVKHQLNPIGRCEGDRLVYDRMTQAALGLEDGTGRM